MAGSTGATSLVQGASARSLAAILRDGLLPELILDVRCSDLFEDLHLKGAYNVPWGEIADRGFELPLRSKQLLVCCDADDGAVRLVSSWFASRTERCLWQVEVLPMTANVLGASPCERGPGPPGRCLFSPSPLLEESWALLRELLESTAGHARALDVGAGSGRDT